MLITKKEAYQLTCPFIRESGFSGQSDTPPVLRHIKCMTDKCMAWKMYAPANAKPEYTSDFGYCSLLDKRGA